MPVDTQTREQSVQAAIREISHIATLPEITVKIVKLVEDPKSTAQDLHTLIANDPALCARVLKVVNSAFYGLPGQIASINRAIVLLGLNAVKNIAIAASLAKLFKGGDVTSAFSAKDLWTHSMAVAAASKMISDAVKLGLADEAFLAGLIHDIGIVVELQASRDKLAQVINKVCPKRAGPLAADMLVTEEEILGANHQDFGKGLCEKWKFPKSFAYVTGHHHNPLQLPSECRTLASVVCIADHLAAGLPGGFSLDLSSPDLPQDVLDDLKLSAAKCDELKAKLPSAVETAAQLMS
jgi:HD-like signal output (HDOD) protein